MTDTSRNGRIDFVINGRPLSLPLPPPSNFSLGRSLTAANLPDTAAQLARSYRQQWQSALRMSYRQKNGPEIAQRLGDLVEAHMREPFEQVLERAEMARLADRVRRLETAPPPSGKERT